MFRSRGDARCASHLTSFKFPHQFRNREPARLPFSLVSVLLVSIALFALVVAFLAAINNPRGGPIVTVAAGVVALVGFIFNAWFTQRQNRIKYTIDLYFARYANATYNDRANIFYEHRAAIMAAPSENALRKRRKARDGTTGDALAQAVLYMLNYWETVATAYVENHLDRDAFDNLSGDVACMVVERTALLIGEKRAKDAEYFENLLAVFWHASSRDLKRRLVPLLGPPSGRLTRGAQSRWQGLRAPPG